jgi:hypothetical protein
LLFVYLNAATLCRFLTLVRKTDMASPKAPHSPPATDDVAAYLDMPPERRAAAKAHAALLSRAAGRLALELPLSADVDDFRRVLTQEAKP